MSESMPKAARPKMDKGYGIDTDTEGMLTWDFVTEQMTKGHNYWVSTTRSDGKPHAAPVWGLWIEGAFYFSTSLDSRKGRNLQTNPNVVIHLESGDEVVILEGTVEQLQPEQAFFDSFANLYEAKYNFRPEYPTEQAALFILRHKVVLAWLEKAFPKTAARWEF